MAPPDDLLARRLYVFDLPSQLLDTLRAKDASASHDSAPSTPATSSQDKKPDERLVSDGPASTTSCTLCGVSVGNVKDQRSHVRSDLHGYNLKQRMRGLKTVTEGEFEKLVGDLDESISGSDSSSSEEEDEDGSKSKDTTLTALLKRQAAISSPADSPDEYSPKKRKRGSGKPPLTWFTSELLPANTSLGVYRAIFTDTEHLPEADMVDVLRKKQLTPQPPPKPSDPTDISNGVALPPSLLSPPSTPHIFLCMVGGGHFAAMVVSLSPKMSKRGTSSGVSEQREATVLAHKTFHRYTTRRKQGGAQSANDASKGAAHSAGSSLRRYNEGALTQEIRSLLSQWKDLIDTSQLLFIRATGTTNRRTLFGPYDEQVLRPTDPRTRSFPFSTRRATQAELMRAFVELTRVKVSQLDEAALAAAHSQPSPPTSSPSLKPTRPLPPRLSPEVLSAQTHTTALLPLIRRSRVPAILAYYATNSLPPSFAFYPAPSHHHTPTPLHLASSLSLPAVILALLTRLPIDPAAPNRESRTAFDLAGDRPTRDAFRVARHELGEQRWDWGAAHVPEGISREDAEKRSEREKKEEEKREKERREAEERRLKTLAVPETVGGKGRKAAEKTGQQKREEEARGLTPEMRMRLERERRARAAEERMRNARSG